jgi:hypothetical protein
VIVLEGKPNLLEIVRRSGPGGGITCLLDSGQQEADEYGDDGDNHQQFHEGKAGACTAVTESEHELDLLRQENTACRSATFAGR